jgi:hypothetical protein
MDFLINKFVLLDISEEHSIEKVTKNLKNTETSIKYKDDDIVKYAHNSLSEFKM